MQAIANQSTFNATQAISTPMAAALPQDAVAGAQVLADDVKTITYLLVAKTQ